MNRAAVNENVRVPIAPANTAGGDITPAMSIPAEADQTIGCSTIAITKARAFPFSWNGEEQRGLNNGPAILASAPTRLHKPCVPLSTKSKPTFAHYMPLCLVLLVLPEPLRLLPTRLA